MTQILLGVFWLAKTEARGMFTKRPLFPAVLEMRNYVADWAVTSDVVNLSQWYWSIAGILNIVI